MDTAGGSFSASSSVNVDRFGCCADVTSLKISAVFFMIARSKNGGIPVGILCLTLTQLCHSLTGLPTERTKDVRVVRPINTLVKTLCRSNSVQGIAYAQFTVG